MSLHNLKVTLTRAISTLVFLGGAAIPALAAPVKDIILVHGAWVDGSGWEPVYKILIRHGYNVTMVQVPEPFRVRVASQRSRRGH